MTTTWRDDPVEATEVVELKVPADPAYLAVIRTAAAGLAARLDLTLDEIEDLRIAVDEACAVLLERRAHEGHDLRASFEIRPGALDVVITGPPGSSDPERSEFSWSVLEALVGTVETGLGTSGRWIRLSRIGNRRNE